MFKYLIVLAVAIAFVMAAPPAKLDQDTASQLYYSGYPGYAGYSAYSAYPAAYAGYGLGYGSAVYYGR